MSLWHVLRLVAGLGTILTLRKITRPQSMCVRSASIGGGISRQDVFTPIALVPLETAVPRHAAEPNETLAVAARADLVFGPA